MGYDRSKLQKVFTSNLDRLIGDPEVRYFLGLKLENKILKTNLPVDELLKGLHKIVTDFSSGEINVKDIYYNEDRQNYLKTFSKSEIPNKDRAYSSYVPLTSLTHNNNELEAQNIIEQGQLTFDDNFASGQYAQISEKVNKVDDTDFNKTITGNELFKRREFIAQESNQQGSSSSTKEIPLSTRRKTLIPKDTRLQIDVKRINAIYRELRNLNVDEFPNCAAVLFRVFFELSIDSYIDKKKIPDCDINSKLVKKLKRLPITWRRIKY